MIKLFNSYAKIDTANTTLLLACGLNKVFKMYYGPKLRDDESYLPIFNHDFFEVFSSVLAKIVLSVFASKGFTINSKILVIFINKYFKEKLPDL